MMKTSLLSKKHFTHLLVNREAIINKSQINEITTKINKSNAEELFREVCTFAHSMDLLQNKIVTSANCVSYVYYCNRNCTNYLKSFSWMNGKRGTEVETRRPSTTFLSRNTGMRPGTRSNIWIFRCGKRNLSAPRNCQKCSTISQRRGKQSKSFGFAIPDLS